MHDLKHLFPELMLTVTALVTIIVDLATKGKRSERVGWFAIAGLLMAGWHLAMQYSHGLNVTAFGMVTIDPFATFFKLFAVAALLVVILFAMGSKEIHRDGTGELYFILISAALGIFFLVSTYNLLLLYLALELLGISSYVLAGFLKGNRGSGEAGLKYVIFGALASGIMLYGLSLIFGITGSLDVRALHAHLVANGSSAAIGIGVALTLVGFGYKISAVPFHFWTPDVYEGSPTPVTTFLAVASKGAAFAALIRFLIGGIFSWGVGSGQEFGTSVAMLLAVIAVVTMTFGNLAALRQTSLKRLLAYSSIAHAGYVLVGLTVMGLSHGPTAKAAFQSSMFYLLAYYFMNLGAFGCVIYFANQTGKDSIDSIRGLGWRAPVAGACFVAFLLSLTGVPPTVGFFGKYYLIVGAVDGGMLWLAIALGLNSVISLFYYFRIAKALYLAGDDAAKIQLAPAPGMNALLLLLAAGTLVFGVYVTPLWSFCERTLGILPTGLIR